MSTNGRGYNPRNSLPVKKNKETKEKVNDLLEISLSETIEDADKDSQDSPEVVDENIVEEDKEENLDDLIKEIHQEVIDYGFKAEAEEDMSEKLKELIGNKTEKIESPKPTNPRDEIPDIIIPKNVRTKDIYEKGFDTLEKVIKSFKENNDSSSPVYYFKKNNSTGKTEMINGTETEGDYPVFNQDSRQEIIKKMLNTSHSDVTKLEIEIYIHEEILKDESDPNKFTNLQRKLDTLRDNLEFLKKRINILTKIKD